MPPCSQVTYGEHAIPFSVSFKGDLKTKVTIHVQPDSRVTVDAPAGTSMTDIKKALLKRARWVSNQRSRLEKLHRYALPRQYVSGETHWYLGKRYLLKVKTSTKAISNTKLLRGQLVVTTQDRQPETIQQLLDDWYQTKATEVFNRRLKIICDELRWVKSIPKWKFRKMTKQWGSCSPKGALSLNPLLVKAPRACIDYVIIHELCHLKHHNHSDQYYRLLHRHCRDWKSTKAKLDNMAEQILI